MRWWLAGRWVLRAGLAYRHTVADVADEQMDRSMKRVHVNAMPLCVQETAAERQRKDSSTMHLVCSLSTKTRSWRQCVVFLI